MTCGAGTTCELASVCRSLRERRWWREWESECVRGSFESRATSGIQVLQGWACASGAGGCPPRPGSAPCYRAMSLAAMPRLSMPCHVLCCHAMSLSAMPHPLLLRSPVHCTSLHCYIYSAAREQGTNARAASPPITIYAKSTNEHHHHMQRSGGFCKQWQPERWGRFTGGKRGHPQVAWSQSPRQSRRGPGARKWGREAEPSASHPLLLLLLIIDLQFLVAVVCSPLGLPGEEPAQNVHPGRGPRGWGAGGWGPGTPEHQSP